MGNKYDIFISYRRKDAGDKAEHFWKYAQMTSFYEQIRQELVDYTEEDKATAFPH